MSGQHILEKLVNRFNSIEEKYGAKIDSREILEGKTEAKEIERFMKEVKMFEAFLESAKNRINRDANDLEVEKLRDYFKQDKKQEDSQPKTAIFEEIALLKKIIEASKPLRSTYYAKKIEALVKPMCFSGSQLRYSSVLDQDEKKRFKSIKNYADKLQAALGENIILTKDRQYQLRRSSHVNELQRLCDAAHALVTRQAASEETRKRGWQGFSFLANETVKAKESPRPYSAEFYAAEPFLIIAAVCVLLAGGILAWAKTNPDSFHQFTQAIKDFSAGLMEKNPEIGLTLVAAIVTGLLIIYLIYSAVKLCNQRLAWARNQNELWKASRPRTTAEIINFIRKGHTASEIVFFLGKEEDRADKLFSVLEELVVDDDELAEVDKHLKAFFSDENAEVMSLKCDVIDKITNGSSRVQAKLQALKEKIESNWTCKAGYFYT